MEIKARRLELGYTQEDLASRSEVDRPFVSLIEVGRKQPSVSVLYALCQALDYSFGDFAERIDKRYRKHLRASKHDRVAGS